MTITDFINKTILFKFRGIDFSFALSQGLFSSADVDTGTRLLLKVFSAVLDKDRAVDRPPPRYVLDAGCGTGIIGICAAAALAKEWNALSKNIQAREAPQVRCQDRDELARLFTLHNAEKNHIPLSVLEAYTEPLLAGPPGAHWDLILANIPAKAGRPVLEDFVRRSAALLNPGGRVIMVAVHTLADFFRGQMAANGIELEQEETGVEHSVFVWAGKTPPGNAAKAGDTANEPLVTGPDFLTDYPFYARNAADYVIEDVPLRIQAMHGAAGFDDPGGAVQSAAKLIRRLGAGKISIAANGTALLVHEPGQGFFPCWLIGFLRQNCLPLPVPVFSGRNILALEAARLNAEAALKQAGAGDHLRVLLRPAPEPSGAEGQRFGFIAAFPELLPQSALPKGSDQLAALWESIAGLLENGGVFVAGFGSGDAERFDRKKPAEFSRLGDIKRKGFRALAYKH